MCDAGKDYEYITCDGNVHYFKKRFSLKEKRMFEHNPNAFNLIRLLIFSHLNKPMFRKILYKNAKSWSKGYIPILVTNNFLLIFLNPENAVDHEKRLQTFSHDQLRFLG